MVSQSIQQDYTEAMERRREQAGGPFVPKALLNPFLELRCSFVAESQYQNLLRVYVLLTDQMDNAPNKSLCFSSSWSCVKNHRSSKSGSCFFLFVCWRFVFC